MNTGQLAELIAAGFFAIGVGVACYVLLRLARLITSATEAVAEYRARADRCWPARRPRWTGPASSWPGPTRSPPAWTT